jgi:primosomal protein N' (replication factor Y)
VVTPLKLKRQQVKAKSSSNVEIAEDKPVAKVLVNTPVSFLEDIYDYLVPAELSESIIAGSIVKIDFGNSKTIGLVLEREDSQKQKLKPIESVMGWPGMISQEVTSHLKRVQDRFGGSLWSLIDTHLPPIPKKITNLSDSNSPDSISADQGKSNAINKEDWEILQSKEGLRYCVNQPAGFKPFEILFNLIAVRSQLGQVLVLASDFREFDFLAKELLMRYPGQILFNDSRNGKVERFHNFQIISRNHPKVILGNRSSVFTPLLAGSSIFIINDNDPSQYEIRSPGWNTRDVSLLRSADTSLFFFNAAPSYEIQRLIDLNWVENLSISSASKINFITTDGRDSFIPVIKKALNKGNVLVSVAAKGYANVFLCSKCRSVANCKCGGKLRIKNANSNPSCYLCEEIYNNWRCEFCGDQRPYVISKGLDRTAEEIARAIPGASVCRVFAENEFVESREQNQVIISSRGCEPFINYAGVILLDGEQIFNQPTLRAEEMIKQNWFDLMSRVIDDGFVYISLVNHHPLTQQILIKQSASPASLLARKESRLPPFYRVCEVMGESKSLSTFAENLKLSDKFLISGPTILKDGKSRIVVRVEVDHASDFADQLSDVVQMQFAKSKAIFEYRFDQYDL